MDEETARKVRLQKFAQMNRYGPADDTEGSGSGFRDMFGDGTKVPTLLDPNLMDPQVNYDIYKGEGVNGFDYATNNAGLANTYKSYEGARWGEQAGERAYNFDTELQVQRDKIANQAGNIKTAGQQALNEQAYLAAMQGDMAGRVAGVQAQGVQRSQTLQGGEDYQGYLRQLAQSRGAADSMQGQADLFGQQYRNPDTTAAMMQMRQATDQNLQSNLALARSSQGAGGLARAMTANAGAQQTAAAQSAQLQAQQEQALRSSWMGAQGNAQQAYQGLAGQQADVAAKAAQTYQAAQRTNEEAAQGLRQGYSAAGTMYGAAGQSWGAQGAASLGREKAYSEALQQGYGNTFAERAQALQQAQYEVQQKQALEQRQYDEWVRQENVRQNWSNQRTAFQASAMGSNALANERAADANRASDAKARGNAMSTAGTVVSMVSPAAGAVFKAAAPAAKNSANNAPSSNQTTQYDPNEDPDTGYGFTGD